MAWRDLQAGRGQVPLPDALARKYPNADREWGWQWVLPAARTGIDRRTGQRFRWHVHETVVQKAAHEAARRKRRKRFTGRAKRHYTASQGRGDYRRSSRDH